VVARDGIEPPTPAFSGPPDRNVQVISVPLRRFRADKNVQGLSIAGAKRGRFKSYEFRNVVAVVTDNPVFKELRDVTCPRCRFIVHYGLLRFARNSGRICGRVPRHPKTGSGLFDIEEIVTIKAVAARWRFLDEHQEPVRPAYGLSWRCMA
jgi:hypothetical protein